VVRVDLSGDASGSVNVLAATRIDLSTGINSQAFPEINNSVVIAGPADVRVAPVTGSALVITCKKEPNEGGGSEEQTPPPYLLLVPLLLVLPRPVPLLLLHLRRTPIP